MKYQGIHSKIYLFYIFFTLCLLGCKPQEVQEDKVIVTSIRMGPMLDDDIEKSEFSVEINIDNDADQQFDHWQLGFYMPGAPLVQFRDDKSKQHNPRLTMQICGDEGNCVDLKYMKAANVIEQDLSQGYTNILVPVKSFPIAVGKSYKLKLYHINQWGGASVSYFPQSFFLLYTLPDSNKEKIQYLDTSIDTYTLTNYNHEAVQRNIIQHNQNNWDESLKQHDEEEVKIIPYPVHLKLDTDVFYPLERNIFIENQLDDNSDVMRLFIQSLIQDIGAKIISRPSNKSNVSKISIQKLVDTSIINENPEGYVLSIDAQQITIQALNQTGLYYAFQTLRQLWIQNQNIEGEILLPALSIIDYPRLRYRGMLLDTVRHFFTVSEIKSFIDIMGVHKLNTLHLHLSDDEAFRLALPSFPELHSVNERRWKALMGPMMFSQTNLYNTNTVQDTFVMESGYKGEYSVDDIKEVIKYANKHQITVIPELDFPAHSRALIKSLPHIFIEPLDKSRYVSEQGYTDNVLPVCVYGTNTTLGAIFTKTINNIINETVELFKGQSTIYAIENEISIGGDEVSPTALTQSPTCDGEWKNLRALDKSHKFFTKLASANPLLKFSGWQQFIQRDDISLGGDVIPPLNVGHVWIWNTSDIGVNEATYLAQNDYPIVLAFADKTYFDIVYTPSFKEPGFAWSSSYSDTHAALSSVQDLKQIEEKTQEKYDNILGLEGALWSEHLPSYEQLIYMSLPKMAGLAEASWSPAIFTSRKQILNWQNLVKRLGCGREGFLSYLNKVSGVEYRGYPHGIALEVPLSQCER